MSSKGGVLVVDIGTESIRSALVNDKGSVVALEGAGPHFVSPSPGWAEQSPVEWWDLTCQTIRSLLHSNPDFDVLAIGVGAQMHAVIPLDKKGEVLLERVPIWCDKRSENVCREIREKLSPDEQVTKAANLLLPAWTGPKMRWVKANQPEVYEQTDVFLTAKDYINFRLTGERYTDHSEASGSFLYSWENRDWDEELLEIFGLEQEKLPNIISSAEVVGKILPAVAEELAIRSEIPVICGAGDMLCLLLGAGMTRHGASCDVTGTAADVSVFSPRPLLTQRLMNLHHAVEGWISFGILDSGGGSMKWLRDAIFRQEEHKISYADIDKIAGRVPAGSEGLLFFPYLMGERLLGSSLARGSYFGILPGHDIKHFARSVMEGVCFDLKMSLDEIEKLYQGNIREMSIIGGGANSDLWCQIKADVYEKEMYTLTEAEGGIVGAALLAFSALGNHTVADIASGWLREKKRFVPTFANQKYYRSQYRLFCEFHRIFQEAYRFYGEQE